MTITEAIQKAEKILPGIPAPDNEYDLRWQAIGDICEFVETHPEQIWSFVQKWGRHENEDLRAAIATILLEHLLQYHFDMIFPRVEKEVKESRFFEATFCICGKFGQSKIPKNSKRFDRLQNKCSVL